MENCCESIVKYFMVLCNILFALAGIILIGFGAYAQIAAKDYLNFLGDNYVNTPIFVIILGGVILAISLFGCCGAYQENKCLIYTYSAVLFIILIAQIAAGIAAFALKGDLKAEITKNMNTGMKNYGAEGFEGVTTTWDLVQKELHCCGVETFADWKNATETFKDGAVPDSCCKGGQAEGCGKAPVDQEKIYTEGCFSLFSDEFNSNLTIVGAVALGIAVGELIAIGFACCLGKRVGRGGAYV
eukprot:TRINITY_DN8789_c0_g1_i6.p1 TRINITY_DN8789_c0_g1~~TRINITY_DN8789_c0_g1_i6.p1  ORF type:complete len:243 (-),score=101.21 TRINITY_DN8789_c0_g1_i6:70-798(-)